MLVNDTFSDRCRYSPVPSSPSGFVFVGKAWESRTADFIFAHPGDPREDSIQPRKPKGTLELLLGKSWDDVSYWETRTNLCFGYFEKKNITWNGKYIKKSQVVKCSILTQRLQMLSRFLWWCQQLMIHSHVKLDHHKSLPYALASKESGKPSLPSPVVKQLRACFQTDPQNNPSWLHSMQLQNSQKCHYPSASGFEDEDLKHHFWQRWRSQQRANNLQTPMAEEEKNHEKQWKEGGLL